MLFHFTSKYIYDWIKKQTNVKEESLTDWLLYFLSEHDKRIYYKAFYRNEEANIGADWEWWVITNSEFSKSKYDAYRFLVQAKKLKMSRDNYPLLSYSNKNGMQIDLLINEAKERNALPLYMYYSIAKADYFYPNDIEIEIVRCCENWLNGCYLSPAITVEDMIFRSPRTKISAEQLLNHALRLSVLDHLIEENNISELLKHVNKQYQKINGDQNFA